MKKIIPVLFGLALLVPNLTFAATTHGDRVIREQIAQLLDIITKLQAELVQLEATSTPAVVYGQSGTPSGSITTTTQVGPPALQGLGLSQLYQMDQQYTQDIFNSQNKIQDACYGSAALEAFKKEAGELTTGTAPVAQGRASLIAQNQAQNCFAVSTVMNLEIQQDQQIDAPIKAQIQQHTPFGQGNPNWIPLPSQN